MKERPDSGDLGLHVREGELMSARPDDDHHVKLRRKNLLVLPEDLSKEAFCPVPLHGAADLSRSDDAQTGGIWRGRGMHLGHIGASRELRGEKKKKVPGAHTRAAVLDADEIGALSNALRAREREAGQAGRAGATSSKWWWRGGRGPCDACC